MNITEKQRKHVAALCKKISATATLIAKDCDTLLQEANESLNEEQITDIGAILKSSQKLLTVANEADQIISKSLHPLAEQKEFFDFVPSLANYLKSPLGLIVGFAQVSLEGINGSLNDQQTESMKHIHELGQMLNSAIDESLLQAREVFKEP